MVAHAVYLNSCDLCVICVQLVSQDDKSGGKPRRDRAKGGRIGGKRRTQVVKVEPQCVCYLGLSLSTVQLADALCLALMAKRFTQALLTCK